MEIDWIIAIGLFLILVAWSFVYYMGFFAITPDLGAGVQGISGKVMNYLEIEAYDTPITYDSTENGTRVLYTDFTWPDYSSNSTKIFSGNQSLPCMIFGNRVYWQADVGIGENKFVMRYHTQNTTLNCDSSFPLVNTTQVIPWAAEKDTLVSQDRIDQMFATDFRAFAAGLGISQDFRIEIETDSSTTDYGSAVLPGYNIYVKENPGMTENNEKVTVRVLTW